MENISLTVTLSKEIDTFFRPYQGEVSKPQLGNLKEMTRGLIETNSVHLLHLGEKVSSETTPRKTTERYSNALDKVSAIDLQDRHILSASWKFKEERKSGDPVLIIPDGGDIQKPHAHKIESLCKTVNGSDGHKVGKGFPLIGIMAYGTKSKTSHPLVTHLYSTETEDFKSQWTEQKDWMGKINHLTRDLNAIVVEDRIGDDAQRIHYYKNEMECSFLVRLTSKRNFLIKDHPEDENFESRNVLEIAKSMTPDSFNTRTYEDKRGQMLHSRIAYTSAQHKDLKDHEGNLMPLFLIAVFTKGYNTPMLLLTDRDPKTVEGAWELFFFYKKRWEIERYYRDIKQSFSLEKTLIRKYSSLQTLVVLVMLAYCLLQRIHRFFHSFLKTLLSRMFLAWKKVRQLREDIPSTLLRFIRHISSEYSPHQSYHSRRWQAFLSRFRKDPSQLSLFDFRKKW